MMPWNILLGLVSLGIACRIQRLMPRPQLSIILSTLVLSLSTLMSVNASNPSSSDSIAEVERFVIESNRDFKRVQALMNESGAESVHVTIAPGEYKLRRSFHIMRSNVTIEGGEGVLLQLAKRAQTPVIAVGTQSSYPEDSEKISNIRISDLKIDGNKEYQKSEYDQTLPWIRNNGIDVRLVDGLTVERVTSNSNRSGGLVISWRCRDVLVRDCVFEDNFFDGVAYYDSSNVRTVDCVMKQNHGAGVSLDNAFVDSLFIRCKILGNRDVGVFARHSERLVFYECEIVDSGNWAVFLAHDEKGHGVFDVDIASCKIARNNGGVRMGSVLNAQSDRNSVTLSSFDDNGRTGRENLSTAGSEVWVFDEAWSDSNGMNPELSEPRSKRIYQAILDIDDQGGSDG